MPTRTSSPIHSNVSGDGPPTTSNFPKHKITHMHKSPAGETPMGSDKLAPRPSKSGAQFPRGSGKSDSAGVTAPKYGDRLSPAVARQITASRNDSWNKFSGVHEGYGRSKPAPYLSDGGGAKKKR
jgi:hypothetical protein